ncbi:MAG: VanZ family protein [Moraxellaceae bacterium]|nr:VanZ family protein [Moraxellaceae bacterium]MDP1776636.1 VanZ family protein [Moraxellaceae bacterium]
MLKRIAWARLFWISVVVVLLLLLIPLNDNPNPGIKHLDKIVHALTFMGLAVLALRAWPKHLLRVFLGLMLLAALTEMLQGLTDWRTVSFADFVADVAGTALVYLCHFIVMLLSYPTVRKTP